MLHNWNIMNSSHHIIFKYIGFVLSRYVSDINLDTTSSFTVFREFGFMPIISLNK